MEVRPSSSEARSQRQNPVRVIGPSPPQDLQPSHKLCCLLPPKRVTLWIASLDIVKYLLFTILQLVMMPTVHIDTPLISIIVLMVFLHIFLIFFAIYLNRIAGLSNPKTKLTLCYGASRIIYFPVLACSLCFIILEPVRALFYTTDNIREQFMWYDALVLVFLFAFSWVELYLSYFFFLYYRDARRGLIKLRVHQVNSTRSQNRSYMRELTRSVNEMMIQQRALELHRPITGTPDFHVGYPLYPVRTIKSLVTVMLTKTEQEPTPRIELSEEKEDHTIEEVSVESATVEHGQQIEVLSEERDSNRSQSIKDDFTVDLGQRAETEE